MSKADCLALMQSTGWDMYTIAGVLVAFVFVVAYMAARRAVRGSRPRFVLVTAARAAGALLIVSDMFDIVVRTIAQQLGQALLSAMGAMAVTVALKLLDGDDWFSKSWSKAKGRARAFLAARRRTRRAVPAAARA